jgi:FKBP-type peptidyl-prolyl cis-trans isomerase FkpA
MRRLAILFALLPVAALAQAPPAKAPAQAPKAPVSTAKPAAPAATAPSPAARKPVPATKAPAATVPRMTDEQKVIYALGLMMQRSIGQFDLSPAELDIVKRALGDAALGKPAIKIDDWGPRIEPLAIARGQRVAAREKVASVAYLTVAAAQVGAVQTDSGLVYRDVAVGTGASPKAGDVVRVHYRGTLINGTEFDSSYKRNEPAEFSLDGVIGCWTEGLQRMKVGGKARLVCPSRIAYGDEGRPSIPGGAALIFDVELLAIVGQR